LGNVDEIKQNYRDKIQFLKREQAAGSFGKDFQISFSFDSENEISDVINLLVEVSNSWTKEELVSAYNLYCKVPVSEINKNNKEILKFAELLDKTPKEIAKRFKNFSKLDASIQILENIENKDINTWNLFNSDWQKSVYESERKLIDLENKLNKISNFPKGKERERIVSTRVNQTFFRMAVLTSYQNKCCITNLPFAELLNASHIIPWIYDESNRLNPRSGLCLNVLHDRAFDRGFITILPDYTIKFSNYMCEIIDNKSVNDYFTKYQNQKIFLPNRFLPEKTFLEYHNQNIFKK
jgi:putative restriction endonuclease